MGRICFEISTGEPLEFQSSARRGTLTANAVGRGYRADDVREQAGFNLGGFMSRLAAWERANLPPKPPDLVLESAKQKLVAATGLTEDELRALRVP